MKVCFLSFILLFSALSAESSYYIGKKDGIITIDRPEKGFVEIAPAGQTLKVYDLLNCDYDSHVLLLNQKGGKVYLSSNSKLAWQKNLNDKAQFQLSKGGCKIDFEENKGKVIHLKVRYGMIAPKRALLYVANQSNHSTLVELDRGEVRLTHRKEEEPVDLKEGQSAVIDATGIHIRERKEKDKKKLRAKFEFREETEDIIAAPSSDKKGEGNKKNLADDAPDESASGKASNAKLVEGQADGAGEYSYKTSNVWMIILTALLITGVIIAIWFKNRNGKKSQASDSSDTSSIGAKSPDAYENQDVFVFRENLTNHHGTFKTEKVTHFIGDIEDGAIIEANHDILIKGSFQGANLHSKANVEIKGGINGQGKAILEIDGDLKAPYISGAKVYVSGNIRSEQGLRNAYVCANNIEVNRKSIMGGTVAAWNSISCQTLGSDYCKTEVHLGTAPQNIWQKEFKQNLKSSHSAAEYNRKANLKVLDELVAATIFHGKAKQDQTKALPGPVSAGIDPASADKLQIRGFRKDES